MVRKVVEFGPDVVRLARRIASSYPLYFSRDLLNSEGRKVFEEMARMLVHEHPELKKLVVRVRRKPTLDNVVRVLERVLGEEAWELVKGSVEGPYRW
ncbi:MAG: hypothetical protein QXL64_08145 [Thermofilaceae archaeon]